MAHELLAGGVRGLWRMLTQPGLVNVDFADLCTVTRGRHAECAMATAEASGECRSRELVDRLLHHPLLEEGRVLQDAQVVLVGMAGGADLALTEVNEVMSQINPLCPNAHIIFGASVDAGVSSQLGVTVLAARRSAADPANEPAGMRGRNDPEAPAAPFCEPLDGARPPSRFVAPAPAITPANADQMLQGLAPRLRRKAVKMVQGQLALDVVSKGRFEKSHPTIRSGQDLDVPTYLRRNLVFN
jgi:cell division protein FtsZ